MKNPDSPDDSSKSEMEQVVDQVCRDFERKFRENPEFRIETLLNEIPEHISLITSDSKRNAARQQIVAELIFVEMELRKVGGQSLITEEYRDRFPDFESAIIESLNRVRKFDAGFRENCSVVTVTMDAGTLAGDLPGELRIDRERNSSVPTLLGPYREISEVNSGGFGIVCRAIDSRDGRVVALKFPRKEKLTDDPDLKMFLAEAGKAMMLEHPGIVRTFSIERADGFLAIVQQFVDGSDLKATKHQNRSHKEIARLVGLIAEALAFAHQKGIYHRDLKPGNILIDRQGRPYVADFGLAVTESEQMFLPKQTCGTAHYMPPEQVAGLTRLLDGRSDIWSLGVILYELLTKRRPFDGVNIIDVFEQIENKDPRPPRQIDPSIAQELQRICLKCLERQQRDRYPTADDLADDLRHWAERADTPAASRNSSNPMNPKGLRSYSAEDAAFFLELLPGPRDRDGLPGSIRFWKTRIVEPVALEYRVPVGVIFGPSGSGKSSFVKAGLLPQIGSEVLTLYIEATQADTEVRLLKTLRQRLVDIPDEISLPDLFRGLGFGHWLPAAYSKLLIVIDQFEQRLSQADDPESSQLARALRYCDGEHLQCLLLTRDDFMMALSRFVDALEMDLREGENAQAIDLFDRKHARKVLTKLGRAYDRLPVEPMALSEVQESFLEEAVDQLAEDNHVICVRLALFAEMFRHRPWTPTELKQVGGVAGTGEKFLEETFGPGSRDKRHRMQREPAKKVLETLLPAGGSDIRGSMKSEHELVVASKLQNHPDQFGDLIKSLDSQLRLITRTDPDRSQADDSQARELSDRRVWYQLTHDYLVPSLRNWIESKQNETAAGRIHARFSKLARLWSAEKNDRLLPTLVEFIQLRWHFGRRELSLTERSLLDRSNWFYLIRSGYAVLFLTIVAILIGWFLHQQRTSLAIEYADRFINGHPEAVLSNVLLMARQHTICRDLISTKLASAKGPEERLRATLGLSLMGDGRPELLTILAGSISPEFDDNSQNIIAALKTMPKASDILIQRYGELEEADSLQSVQCRARLAITLCFLGRVGWVADRIANESADVQTLFVETICFWHGQLEGLESFLLDENPETSNAVFCLAIGRLFDEGLLSAEIANFEPLRIRAASLYHDCRTNYLLSSSDWMLNKTGKPESQRRKASTPGTQLEQRSIEESLLVNSLNVRMHRIPPRVVKLHAYIRGKLYEIEEEIPEPFYAAVREVSVADFRLFLADQSYAFEMPVGLQFSGEGDTPATGISYVDAIMFCNWLSRKEGLVPCYAKLDSKYDLGKTINNEPSLLGENMVPLNQWVVKNQSDGFRLPTYAEWQCLEKVDESDYFDFGSKELQFLLPNYGWFATNSTELNSRARPRKTRQKMPNRNGLFDIYGNGCELCWDFPFRAMDSNADETGFYAVGRGNSFATQPLQVDQYKFDIFLPVTRASNAGFRLVIGISTDK